MRHQTPPFGVSSQVLMHNQAWYMLVSPNAKVIARREVRVFDCSSKIVGFEAGKDVLLGPYATDTTVRINDGHLDIRLALYKSFGGSDTRWSCADNDYIVNMFHLRGSKR